MNSRIAHIAYLLSSEGALDLERLSGKLNLSQRLVRYEVDRLNAFLASRHLDTLEKTRSGLRFTSEELAARALQEITFLPLEEFVLSPEERHDVEFLLMLCSGDRLLTSQQIASDLQVSPSIIDRDMAYLKETLKKSGLELASRSGKGRVLCGDEALIRRHAIQLIERNIDFSVICSPDAFIWNAVMRWLCQLGLFERMKRAVGIVSELESGNFGRWLAFDSLRIVVYALAVLLARLAEGKVAASELSDLPDMATSREYVYAIQLSQEVSKSFGVTLPDHEINYLSTMLMGAKYVTPDPYLREDWIGLQMLLDRLVTHMEDAIGAHFSSDQDLIDALQNHLGPMVFRLRHGIATLSPDVGEARQAHPECFEALAEAIQRESTGPFGGLSEGDVSYLALYFCASLERMKRKARSCRIAIVCMHGTAAANLIRERVMARFPDIRVVAIATNLDVDSLLELNVDFIVSNVALPVSGIPWIQVKTCPDEGDWIALEEMIQRLSHESQASMGDSKLLDSLMRIVQQHCTILEPEPLLKGIASELDSYGLTVHEEHVQPRLSALLTSDRLCVCPGQLTWEEAVRCACRPLELSGDVADGFVERALDDLRREGPCFVFMPGVALVHSKAGENVRKLGMSCAIFPEGVHFGHHSFDPVHLVFCLAATDNWSHIRALRGLLDLLLEVEVDEFCKVKSSEELFEIMGGA